MIFILLLAYYNITTNLSSHEIEERYGVRVRSRMREMFILDYGKTPIYTKFLHFCLPGPGTFPPASLPS